MAHGTSELEGFIDEKYEEAVKMHESILEEIRQKERELKIMNQEKEMIVRYLEGIEDSRELIKSDLREHQVSENHRGCNCR